MARVDQAGKKPDETGEPALQEDKMILLYGPGQGRRERRRSGDESPRGGMMAGRAPRLIRDNRLLAPQQQSQPVGAKRPNQAWGTDATVGLTQANGHVAVSAITRCG